MYNIIIIYLFIHTHLTKLRTKVTDKVSNKKDLNAVGKHQQLRGMFVVWIKNNDRSNSWKVEAFSEMKKYYSYTIKKEVVNKNSLLLVLVHCTIIVYENILGGKKRKVSRKWNKTNDIDIPFSLPERTTTSTAYIGTYKKANSF